MKRKEFEELELFKTEILSQMGICEGEEERIIDESIRFIRKNWKKRERYIRRHKDAYYYIQENEVIGRECLKENLRSKKLIYLVSVSEGKTDLSKAIMSYTDSDYFHVAIALDKSLTNLYSFSPHIEQGELLGGFACENIHTYKKMHYYIRVSSMLLDVDKFERLLYEISIMMKRQKKTEYNYFGLVNYILKREEETDGYRMFCSQFIVYLFQRIGIDLIEKQPCFVTPEDIAALEIENGIYRLYDGNAEFYCKEKIHIP